jgi:hypothetical protein
VVRQVAPIGGSTPVVCAGRGAARTGLVLPQRDDRIDSGGAPRRNVARDERDHGHQSGRGDERRRVEGTQSEQQHGHRPRDEGRADEADPDGRRPVGPISI